MEILQPSQVPALLAELEARRKDAHQRLDREFEEAREQIARSAAFVAPLLPSGVDHIAEVEIAFRAGGYSTNYRGDVPLQLYCPAGSSSLTMHLRGAKQGLYKVVLLFQRMGPLPGEPER